MSARSFIATLEVYLEARQKWMCARNRVSSVYVEYDSFREYHEYESARSDLENELDRLTATP